MRRKKPGSPWRSQFGGGKNLRDAWGGEGGRVQPGDAAQQKVTSRAFSATTGTLGGGDKPGPGTITFWDMRQL